MSGVETSPARKRHRARARLAEDRRWSKMAGPVEVRTVDPTPADDNAQDGANPACGGAE